jgi:hypothetical protein
MTPCYFQLNPDATQIVLGLLNICLNCNQIRVLGKKKITVPASEQGLRKALMVGFVAGAPLPSIEAPKAFHPNLQHDIQGPSHIIFPCPAVHDPLRTHCANSSEQRTCRRPALPSVELSTSSHSKRSRCRSLSIRVPPRCPYPCKPKNSNGAIGGSSWPKQRNRPQGPRSAFASWQLLCSHCRATNEAVQATRHS